MPIYTYYCEECEIFREELVQVQAPPIDCEVCINPMKRVIDAPAGVMGQTTPGPGSHVK